MLDGRGVDPLAILNLRSWLVQRCLRQPCTTWIQIERLDLRIGDTVVIEKAGDVIPKVVEVLIKLRTGKEKKFKMPERCPACGGKIDKKNLAGKGQTLRIQRSDLKEPELSVAYFASIQNVAPRMKDIWSTLYLFLEYMS